MDETLHTSSRLSREDMRKLLARRDGPGIALFGVQFLGFLVLSWLTLDLAAAGSAWRWPVVLADGLVLLMFFASMHEAGHGTAFATGWMNRAVLRLSALLMLQSPTFFREFHFEHHRSTSDPAGDPEISGAPAIFGSWPSNPLLYFLIASGQHLMLGKAAMTLAAALVPGEKLFSKLFPYIRPQYRRQVVLESRLVSVAWIAALWLGFAYVDGFGTLLLAWPIAHVGLGLFVMPEHTGLGSEGTQLRRTRSMRSNAVVQNAMWHMSWHAEHHGYPAVPFHALPELHRRIAPELENLVDGYLAFHAEALRRSCGRFGRFGRFGKDPQRQPAERTLPL